MAALLVLAFLLGIAFARTLDEQQQQQGDVVTTVRTLTAGEERATSTVTVTVTVTEP